MAAILLIDQAGLPAGAAGFARTDGLNTGALVTIQSVGQAQTHEARILFLPELDTNSIASFAQTSSSPPTWTFTPTASVDGMWVIELVTDRGLPSQDRQVRVFGVRDSNALLFPSYGLVADPGANIPDLSDSSLLSQFVDANVLNEPSVAYPSGNPFGYWKELDTILRGAAGGAVGAGGALIWEWNQSTTDQFDTGNVWVEPGGRIGSLTVSAAANLNIRNEMELRFTPGGFAGGGDGWAAIMINQAITARRLLVEVELLDCPLGGFGLLFFGDDTSGQYGYLYSLAGSVRGGIIENEVATDAIIGGVTAPNTTKVFIQSHFDLEKIEAPSTPIGTLSGQGMRTGSTQGYSLLVSDLGAPGAGWNNLDATRFGFAVYAGAGTSPGATRVASIRIFDTTSTGPAAGGGA